jgi:formylglycine-generating enzyme required for sulfatase activity
MQKPPGRGSLTLAPTLLAVLAAITLTTGFAAAQDTLYPPIGEGVPGPELCGEAGYLPLGGQIPGPERGDEDLWLEGQRRWRAERLIRAGYDGSGYEHPGLRWTRSSFVQAFVMIHDRLLYDPESGAYTVDRLLDDLDARYGGPDAVLLWHSYPNLGVDHRNQYDLLRDLPGGIEGVAEMIRRFHERGVRVLFPINLWDRGTSDEGEADWDAVARLMAEIGADGLNGDTLAGFPEAFRSSSDAVGHPLVLEPTDSPPPMGLAWNTMSWGLCWKYSFRPLVSTFKWLEPRHMVHVAPRWGRDKTDDLQFAFFNGVGIVAWENIWGIWNGLTERDAETLRRTAAIERATADLLVSADWRPFAPTTREGVFASRFPGDDGRTLWLLINRSESAIDGPQLTVSEAPGASPARYFDLWHGTEIQPRTSADGTVLDFPIAALGFGAILRVVSEPRPEIRGLLAEMRERSATPLAGLSTEWSFLPQTIVEPKPTEPASTPPAGMIRIPAGEFEFVVSGIEIEGGEMVGVDVQYPWEESPRRHHRRRIEMEEFFIDEFPVTNAEFARFLEATDYRPADRHNFLRHWEDGQPPAGGERAPVTWVSIEDARAYASWAGKRLPREWEWQYAAQGTDGRLYPWGDDWRAEALPPADTSRSPGGPPEIGSHPVGASPFGVQDLVGSVWQWTDEYRDERTRSAVLRGGSFYRPQGSRWYFPQAYRLDQHGKYLLMAPSLDRSATIGFRCARDAG